MEPAPVAADSHRLEPWIAVNALACIGHGSQSVLQGGKGVVRVQHLYPTLHWRIGQVGVLRMQPRAL